MSLFTHWACFDCRKSFAKEPLSDGEQPRICSDCAKPMIDMGKYFTAPRRLNKKRWEVMSVLAENGYKFQTEGAKFYIEKYILKTKNPRLSEVKETVEAEKQAKIKSEQDSRVKLFKESKGKL
jgi:hypothetical protein